MKRTEAMRIAGAWPDAPLRAASAVTRVVESAVMAVDCTPRRLVSRSQSRFEGRRRPRPRLSAEHQEVLIRQVLARDHAQPGGARRGFDHSALDPYLRFGPRPASTRLVVHDTDPSVGFQRGSHVPKERLAIVHLDFLI